MPFNALTRSPGAAFLFWRGGREFPGATQEINIMEKWLWAYILGDPGTFIYLTFFDGYVYTDWNWIIAVPANLVLSMIWPVYSIFLRWIF